jgi:hypothetical protein
VALGANVNQENTKTIAKFFVLQGRTPITHALTVFRHERQREIIDVLMEAGADPFKKQLHSFNATPLILAAYHGSKIGVEWMLERYPELDLKEPQTLFKITYISTACYKHIYNSDHESDAVIRLLAKHGAEPHRSVGSGANNLDMYFQNGIDTDMMDFLLGDISVEYQMRSQHKRYHAFYKTSKFMVRSGSQHSFWTSWAHQAGATPLINAVFMSNTTAVQWLLEKGAKVDTPNDLGYTAISLARQQGDPYILKMLEAARDNVPVDMTTSMPILVDQSTRRKSFLRRPTKFFRRSI